MREKVDVKLSEKNRRKDNLLHVRMTFYLFLFVSAVIFLYLVLAYLGTVNTNAEKYFSDYFAVSTALLLLSAYPFGRFLNDIENKANLLKGISLACITGVMFLVFQIIGMRDTIAYSDSYTVKFLTLITGLHLIYLLTLIIASAYFMLYFNRKLSDPVNKLIVCTNPYEKLKLELTTAAWYFLSVVWAVVFVTFSLML